MMWGWEAYAVTLTLILFGLASKRGDFFWLVLWACFQFSAVRVFINPQPPFMHEQLAWIGALDRAAGSTLALAFILYCGVREAPRWLLNRLFDWVALINALLMIGGGLFYGKPYGILLNSSMSGCFAVALIPHICRRDHWPVMTLLLSILAAVMSRQSQPLGMLIVLFATLALSNRAQIHALFWAVIGGFAAYSYLGDTLFDSSGRVWMWARAMKFFTRFCNPWLGAGAGAFSVVGPYLSQPLPESFIWLHSDWLQILFEQGYLGLALASAFFVFLVRSRPARMQLLVVLYGAWMCANMPWHYPLAAVFGLFIMLRASEEGSEPASSCQA